MLPFIARRLVEGTLVLITASFIAFALLNFVPGDAAQVLVGDSASQAELDAIREELGLDQPLLYRYSDYMGQAITKRDFGKSLISGRLVSEVIRDKFKNTMILAITTTILGVLGGFFIGMIASRNRGKWLDLAITSGLSVLLAIPGFLMALILVWIFSLWLGVLPVTGGGSLKYMILPCLTLTFPMIAVIARLSRASLLDAAERDYVLTARAKGLSSKLIWYRHILKNAALPVLHFTGVHFGHLLGGAFIVETIYGWPGLGRQIVLSILEHDYPIIIASVILIAFAFQIIHLTLDLAHGFIDPRSRLHSK